MRRIPLNALKPGMHLSQALVAPDRTVLLHEGIELKQRYLEYLRNQGITYLYIDDAPPAPSPVKEPSQTELRQQAKQTARKVIHDFRLGKGVPLDKIKDLVNNLVSRILDNPETMHHLMDIRQKEDYMFSHAVNTCLLSVLTGTAMGYEAHRLEELGLAAMLHDVGKIKFTKRLSAQFPRRLTAQEKEEYRQHPFYTLEILKENKSLSMDIINACFQHHERWDGSGYPMGISGDVIHEYAQIISIADVYDRLITGLPHRKPTPVYYAAAILNKAAGTYFNPEIVAHFTKSIAVYPLGSTVKLDNNQLGLIVEMTGPNNTIPVVRILADEDSTHLNQLLELDLNKNPEHFIIDFDS